MARFKGTQLGKRILALLTLLGVLVPWASCLLGPILEYEVQAYWESVRPNVLKFMLIYIAEHPVRALALLVTPLFFVAAFLLTRKKILVLYDSRKRCDQSDFFEKSRSTGPGAIKAQGRLIVDGEKRLISIERLNTEGRFDIYLQNYDQSNPEVNCIAKDTSLAGEKRIKVSFSAKRIDADHMLRFAFKDKHTDKGTSPRKKFINHSSWRSYELSFELSPAIDWWLEISDMEVSSAPSSVQIRGLQVVEVAA